MGRIRSVESPEVAIYTLPIIATMTGEGIMKRLKRFEKLESFGELPRSGMEGNGRKFLVRFNQRSVTNAFWTEWRRHRERVHYRAQQHAPKTTRRMGRDPKNTSESLGDI